MPSFDFSYLLVRCYMLSILTVYIQAINRQNAPNYCCYWERNPTSLYNAMHYCNTFYTKCSLYYKV